MRRDQLTLSIALLVSGSLLFGMFSFSSGDWDLLADSGKEERSPRAWRTVMQLLRLEGESSPRVASRDLVVSKNPVVSEQTLLEETTSRIFAGDQEQEQGQEQVAETSTPLAIYQAAVEGSSSGSHRDQIEEVFRDNEGGTASWSLALWALLRAYDSRSLETMARYLDSGAPLAGRVEVLRHLGGMEDSQARQ